MRTFVGSCQRAALAPKSMFSTSRVYDRRQVADPEPKLEMTRLGSYTIVRKLARGGMAELFLARSVGPEGFEKLVVVKKILPRYAENPRFVQLFLDEAKLAASFDDPRIVQVYDMGRVDGNYFFAMEYVHGQDLRSILRRTDRNKQKTPIDIAVQIVRTVAGALHHAHERRRADGAPRDIVHRDVSPSNILVSYDGAIKLADFGVAKAATSTTRTRTGTLKGKVGYMSPEQARGLAIDRRSDIFSLGVVLWELVSVRRLFKTDNDLATIQAIINSPPPALTKQRPECPPELERIVNKALEKEPGVRFQTAQQMQVELEELAREQKLNMSAVALSEYVTGLFEVEIAAWREAQQAGATVTEFLVHSGGPPTPVSESELSVDAPFAEPSEEDAADEDAELDDGDDPDDIDQQTTMPPQPPTAGATANDAALDEATAIAAPPIMPDELDDSIEDKPTRPPQPPDPIFDQVATTLQANPFEAEPETATATTALSLPFEPTPQPRPAPPPRRPETSSTTLVAQPYTPPAGVHVSPQTPPAGTPMMSVGYPANASNSQLPAQTGWESPILGNLTPERRLVIFAAVTGALIVIVVIIAIIAGGNDEPPVQQDDTTDGP